MRDYITNNRDCAIGLGVLFLICCIIGAMYFFGGSV